MIDKKIGNNIKVVYMNRDEYDPDEDYTGISKIVIYRAAETVPEDHIPERPPFHIQSIPFTIPEISEGDDIEAAVKPENTDRKTVFQAMNEELLEEAELEDE